MGLKKQYIKLSLSQFWKTRWLLQIWSRGRTHGVSGMTQKLSLGLWARAQARSSFGARAGPGWGNETMFDLPLFLFHPFVLVVLFVGWIDCCCCSRFQKWSGVAKNGLSLFPAKLKHHREQEKNGQHQSQVVCEGEGWLSSEVEFAFCNQNSRVQYWLQVKKLT